MNSQLVKVAKKGTIVSTRCAKTGNYLQIELLLHSSASPRGKNKLHGRQCEGFKRSVLRHNHSWDTVIVSIIIVLLKLKGRGMSMRIHPTPFLDKSIFKFQTHLVCNDAASTPPLCVWGEGLTFDISLCSVAWPLNELRPSCPCFVCHWPEGRGHLREYEYPGRSALRCWY